MRSAAAQAMPWLLQVLPSAQQFESPCQTPCPRVRCRALCMAPLCSALWHDARTLLDIKYSAALLYPASWACSCRSEMIFSTMGELSVPPEDARVSYAVYTSCRRVLHSPSHRASCLPCKHHAGRASPQRHSSASSIGHQAWIGTAMHSAGHIPVVCIGHNCRVGWLI